MISARKALSLTTRLTYNCAHLRSTKESLTFEYLAKKPKKQNLKKPKAKKSISQKAKMLSEKK